jgi:cytochrome c553
MPNQRIPSTMKLPVAPFLQDLLPKTSLRARSKAVWAGLFVAVAMAQPAFAAEEKAAPKVDAAKGGAISAQVCGACHTADGSRGSPANPILQGQHPEYLVKQLGEFKAGKRDSAVMKGFASTLSDEDMRNVAAFYASKQAKPGAAKSKDLVTLGEKIYRGGIAERSVPACAGCHSPTGAGIPAQYPRLAGQHSDYTETQLKNFRDGARKNNAQMAGVAARMNDRELKAVADYIAGLH